ncbi:hypothetical protein H257_05723 [Aphanomyces astaci]|uniref:Uncharacterized protein n=1 Tax=Aphanomyces astaci TaxID=112090 RepID=W4GP72_APHAT|nr:hypothetical protein H257_05723 [Aphanomyces astaci]ETV81126.1 hypothetical protein H257_05723 [Aphanomyces astaci]|eukprot:XP_009828984.1 hypothetical protein H257_05723 [Aphanomyces astaci]
MRRNDGRSIPVTSISLDDTHGISSATSVNFANSCLVLHHRRLDASSWRSRARSLSSGGRPSYPRNQSIHMTRIDVDGNRNGWGGGGGRGNDVNNMYMSSVGRREGYARGNASTRMASRAAGDIADISAAEDTDECARIVDMANDTASNELYRDLSDGMWKRRNGTVMRWLSMIVRLPMLSP